MFNFSPLRVGCSQHKPAPFNMSKGNMLLGYARGKVGDLVFSRQGGQQVTRARAAQVSNPRTTGQMIQRMIFAAVSFAYSMLRPICDHSFEGVQYGQRSMSKFFSLNLKALRAYYPTDQDPDKRPVDGMAFILPSREGAIGCGLQISAGTIPEVAPRVNENGVWAGFGKEVETEGALTIAGMLECLGAEVGDQITLVVVTDDNQMHLSRYVTRADATTAELSAAWDSTGAAAAFDASKTSVDIQLETAGGGGTGRYAYVDAPEATSMTIIISRRDSNGKWLRSNAHLWNTADEAPQYSAAYALPYWETSGTDIETLNKKYLNNADK